MAMEVVHGKVDRVFDRVLQGVDARDHVALEGSDSRHVLREGLLDLLDLGQPGDGARVRLLPKRRPRQGGIEVVKAALVMAQLIADVHETFIGAEALLRQVLGDLIDLDHRARVFLRR
eukprot:scaffold22933_cov36-Phaeocystis_antarctica.AAC.1